MPNCFQLFPKGSSEPAILQRVDEAICRHFGEPVDPVRWVAGWYHCIGFLIALKGYQLGSRELRLAVVDWYSGDWYSEADRRIYIGQMVRILKFLEDHYTSTSWVEIGKR